MGSIVAVLGSAIAVAAVVWFVWDANVCDDQVNAGIIDTCPTPIAIPLVAIVGVVLIVVGLFAKRADRPRK